MRNAYGQSDLIGKAGSQGSLVLKSSHLRDQGIQAVMGVIFQHLQDGDLNGADRMLPMRKMRSTN